jgi:hypothetical protein
MEGGEKVNKKIVIMGMTLLALTLLVAPVMAEPLEAEVKNDTPNAEIIVSIYGFQMLEITTPSEVRLRWIYFPESTIHTKVKYADKFSNPTKLDVGDDFMTWLTNQDYREKWVKMSKTGYLNLHTIFGFPAPEGVPEAGVYIWGK